MRSASPDTLDRLAILLATSDEARARKLCSDLQAEQPGLRIRLAADLPAAVQAADKQPVQMVLWWLDKLDASALRQVEEFITQRPEAGLVVAAQNAGTLQPASMVLAGAQECLCGNPSPAEMVNAIRLAAARTVCAGHLVSERRLYRSIVFCQSELICRFSPKGELSFMNPAYRHYIGLISDEPPAGGFFQQMAETDRREVLAQLDALEPAHPLTRMELRVQPRPGGEQRWLHWSIHAMYDQNDKVCEYQAVGQDITEAKNLEEALQVAEANLRQLIVSNADGMVVTDEQGIVLFVNPAAERLLNTASYDLLGQKFAYALTPGQRQELELKPGAPEGIVVEMRVVETKWRRDKAFLATLRDISELKMLQEELRELSLIDPLTGIYNRRGFTTLARQQIRTAQRMGKCMHLFFVDLDDLKKINDTMGHDQGDQVIREAALVLKATFRESDILGRWGGDEFSVLVMDTDEEGPHAALDRLNLNLQDWNTDTVRPYKISLSTGTATFDPERPSTLESMLSQADQNMYEIKRGHRAESGPSSPARLRGRS